MKKRLLLIGVMIGVIITALWHRRATRFELLIDPYQANVAMDQRALEKEVTQAELDQYGPELLPQLRAELKRGSWRRNNWFKNLNNAPLGIGKYFSRKYYFLAERRRRAAECLGMLGPSARDAIPDLESVSATSGYNDAEMAKVALALIQPDNPVVQSNLLSMISPTSPRGLWYDIAVHAHELWPTHPEILSVMLAYGSADVQSVALDSLGTYGPLASNVVKAVKQALNDPYVRVRPHAALALVRIAPDQAELALAALRDLARTNKSWKGYIPHDLYQALGPTARAAVPSLEGLIKDSGPDWYKIDVAVSLWRITGRATPDIVSALVTGIRMGPQRWQIRSLQVLKEIGPLAIAAAPELRKLTRHPRFYIQQLAVEALASVERTPAGH